MKTTFSEDVFIKAKELEITPKLLLISIGAIAEGKNDDVIILKHFWPECLNDAENIAREQQQDKRPNRRKAGFVAFDVLPDSFQDELQEIKGVGRLSDFHNNPVLWIHYAMWNSISNEFRDLTKKYRCASLSTVVSQLCSELIERCRQLAEVMNPDINPN